MAAKQSSLVVRVVATVFTSLVAPTLVALITTTIRDTPRSDSIQTVCSYRGASLPVAPPTPMPAVTLLPPEPTPNPKAAMRAPLVWRPVAASDAARRGGQTASRRD